MPVECSQQEGSDCSRSGYSHKSGFYFDVPSHPNLEGVYGEAWHDEVHRWAEVHTPLHFFSFLLNLAFCKFLPTDWFSSMNGEDECWHKLHHLNTPPSESMSSDIHDWCPCEREQAQKCSLGLVVRDGCGITGIQMNPCLFHTTSKIRTVRCLYMQHLMSMLTGWGAEVHPDFIPGNVCDS